MTTQVESARWREQLREFTSRNAGRSVRLETDDRRCSFSWPLIDLPLRAILQDPEQARIELVLGERSGLGDRLTHSIEDVRAVEVRSAPNGADRALRIVHGGGETRLVVQP
ncbi:MAG: hypothetical protein ACR2F9_07805 [Longimicrobiaceae bacterium]